MMPESRVMQDARTVYDFLSDWPAVPEHADLILAAGTYDLRVADHAARLYHRGVAPLVVCSGGFGKVTSKLFHKPEGELFAQRCLELGVPESAIVAECRSTNTGENFTFSRELLAGRAIRTGVVACKPYMVKRVWATGTKQWPEVRWSVSGVPLSFEAYPEGNITLSDTIQLMVGDLQRLWVYEEKGFQAHVEVPREVLEAYERLVRAGFNQYVITQPD